MNISYKYAPIPGKLLVSKYGEEVMVSRIVKELDEEKNKDKDPRVDIMETKNVEKILPSNFQLALVVAAPELGDEFKYGRYKVGDIIVYKYGGCISFDLDPNLYLMDVYNVVATYEV